MPLGLARMRHDFGPRYIGIGEIFVNKQFYAVDTSLGPGLNHPQCTADGRVPVRPLARLGGMYPTNTSQELTNHLRPVTGFAPTRERGHRPGMGRYRP